MSGNWTNNTNDGFDTWGELENFIVLWFVFWVILNLSDEIVRIPLHEIIYIDVDRNYITVHANQEYIIKKTLSEIEKELDERFFRIGRSAIVNLKFISRVTKQDVFLSNGVVLQLPRGMYEALNRAIINEM